MFLQGRNVKFPGYDEKVEEEKAWASELMNAAVPSDVENAHATAPVINPSIAPFVNVKAQQLADEQMAIAYNEALIFEMGGAIIDVESPTLEEHLEALFGEEGIVAKQEIPQIPVAPPPITGCPRQLAADSSTPVFLGVPGHGYERKMLVPVHSMNTLLAQGACGRSRDI